MLAEFVDKLVGLGGEISGVKFHKHNELVYATKQLHEMPEHMVDPLLLRSLTGLVDLIMDEKEAAQDSMMIHVESPVRVSFFKKQLDKKYRRICPASVDISNLLPQFKFGQYYGQEEFIINLQTSFQRSDARDGVIKAASNVSSNSETELVDDGTSQRVSANAGIVLKKMVDLPNPVELAPYATFSEVEQIARPYVFRASKNHDGVSFALFANESRHWEAEAMERIKEYLHDKTGLLVV